MSDGGPSKRPWAIPIAVAPLLVVLVLLGTTVGLRVFHPDREVPVLAKDVAAGQRITGADLAATPKSVSGFGLGEVARARDAIKGHVARTDLRAGEAISPDALTAAAVPADFPTRTLLRFRTENATTVEVDSGSSVKLMFAPTGDAAVPGPEVVDAVLIDETQKGDEAVYFVAVRPGDVPGLLARLGRSRLLVGRG